ncbi:hypothetical protein [Spirosoma areae]
MRYIAVFDQQETNYAVGFDTPGDALDFLFWGYEEFDLLPYGIFDVLSGEVTIYEHRGDRVSEVDAAVISQTAKNYLKGAIRRQTT